MFHGLTGCLVHAALVVQVSFLFMSRLVSLLVLTSLMVRSAIAEEPPPWAYGFKIPVPADWTPPAPGATAPPSAAASDPTEWGLSGTDRKFTRAQITNIFGPADFYPEDHPVMPEIVARGKAPAVWACSRCHYANGKGRPENAGIAGLPVDYFIAQLQAFKNGERQSSDPRKPNTVMMANYAKGLTDVEMRAAAEYYGSMKWTPWIRVKETERVPQTTTSAGMYLPVAGGADEAIGNRIIEVPEDPELVEIQRSPRVGFVAYVPTGSVKQGELLVTTGGGKTIGCVTCHGPGLQGQMLAGVGTVPGIAGRSPSYLFRQMFDMKSGRRHGKQVEFMKPVVMNLNNDDMLAISAYLASITP